MSESPEQLHPLQTIEEVSSVGQSPVPETHLSVEDEDSEEEGFSYPGASSSPAPVAAPPESIPHAVSDPLQSRASEDDSEEEEFKYPGPNAAAEETATPDPPKPTLVAEVVPETNEETNETVEPETPQTPDVAPTEVVSAPVPEPAVVSEPDPQPEPTPAPIVPTKKAPTSAQLEALHAAASSGNMSALKSLFQDALSSGEVEPFALSNDASPRTGLTALHAAASRGHLEIAKYLVEECGAIPDMEDKEGETALHKAALHGHLDIVRYLLPNRADVHAQDADGWTALHNACSKGYLDVVRWLCEEGGASEKSNRAPGVDVRSRGGWTPLMNAASKGHLPVVLYLLTKQNADPLVRNNWGETAYDVAAAVFEVWICEVLQKAELEKWRATTVQYNPLAVHTSVPLVLYEHQRLDMRLKTLAVSGGKPKFSASGLGRRGRRAPFELKLPAADEETGQKELPAWRSDVHLPLREEPFKLPKPGAQEAMEGAERSHFWLSDWTLDVTHPGVDAEEGWQYSHNFSDPDEQWTAEQTPQLQRLLGGSGAMTAGLGGSSSSRSSSSPDSQRWVRRRRWVRVMRRRLDIPPLPFMQPDGAVYHLDADGALVPHVETNNDEFDDHDGQELSFMPTSGLPSSQDYVARARYLAGTQHSDAESVRDSSTAVEARRAIAKLERATTELHQGILSDNDAERRTQAEVLLNAYTRELERRRLAAGAQGLLISGDGEYEDDDDDSDEEFHYPGASPQETIRPSSIRSGTTDYFARPSSSRGPTDLTPHLSQAPEFRVPTHEAPQKVLTPRWTAPTPHQVHAQWERDDAVTHCRDCRRKFTFLNRRHHCRRCGRIFCDRCSSYRTLLDPSDIVHDPAFSESSSPTSQQRVCQACYEEVTAVVPQGLHSLRTTSMERIVVDQRRLSIPSPTSGHGQTNSQISDLADCPVCGANLPDVGPPALQEAHVKSCLEGGTGTTPQAAKYLVYKLPEESTLIGTECVICLEEFVKGSTVARLSCLCSFHNACLSSWLQRGRSCPVHAR